MRKPAALYTARLRSGGRPDRDRAGGDPGLVQLTTGDVVLLGDDTQRDLVRFAEEQKAKGRKWENARPIGSSWAYNRQESDAGTYSSAAQLVREIVDVVANAATSCSMWVPRAQATSRGSRPSVS